MTKQTALFEQHKKLNAKIAEFAGYDMPIQYPTGVIEEHEWTRKSAGIFDVSHMGQIIVKGKKSADFWSKVTPSLFNNIPHSRAKYTVLTNETGGIIDDLIITRINDNEFFAVINAGCKEKDIKWLQQNLTDDVTLERLDNRSLIAVQGPKAEEVVEKITGSNLKEQAYMSISNGKFNGSEIFISRLGYTGEDGFEISVDNKNAASFWEALLANEHVKPIGLAARDSLRLEMGYPLYGHDIDDKTSPIEADLGWVTTNNHNGFFGDTRINQEKQNGTTKKRVGIKLTGKGIAREGAEIFNLNNEKIGIITSGSFSPTLKKAIGQGYVETKYSAAGENVIVKVRKNEISAIITQLPFISPKTRSMKFKK